MTHKDVKRPDLRALLLDDVLEMSEKELNEELRSRGVKLDDLVRRFDGVLERSACAALPALYVQAKQQLQSEQRTLSLAISVPKARVVLNRLATSGSTFLLAAREGRALEEMPDDEIESLASDLIELGLIKSDEVEK